MDNRSKNYFTETWWLINHLYHSEAERENFIREINKTGNIAKVYRGVPIKRHFLILGSIDPEFKKFSTIDTSGRAQTVHSINKLTANDILQTLLGFYSDEKAFQELTKKASIETHLLTAQDKEPPKIQTPDEEKIIDDRDKKIKGKEAESNEDTIKSAETKLKTENPVQETTLTNQPSGSVNSFNNSPTPVVDVENPTTVLEKTTGVITTAKESLLNNPDLANTAQNVMSTAQIKAQNIGADLASGTKNWVTEAVNETFGAGSKSVGTATPIVDLGGANSPFENERDLETYHAGQHQVNIDPETQNNQRLSPEDRALFEQNFKTATSWNQPEEEFVDEEQGSDNNQPGSRISRRELQQLQREFESQPETRAVESLPRRNLFNRPIETPNAVKDFGSQAQIRVGQGIQATGKGLGSAGRGLLGNVGRLFGLGGGSAAGGAAVGGAGAAGGAAAAAGGTAAAGGIAAVGWPVLVIILIIVGVILLFLLIFFFINYWQETNALFPPFDQTTVSAPVPGPGTGPVTPGDIATCTFYRGTTDTGTKMGNTQFAPVISDIANKVGIPNVLLTAIFKVETPEAFASKDTSYLTNDYDAHKSGAGAIGVMQILPDTFSGIFGNNREALKTSFGKDNFIITIDPQNQMKANNYLRIYSIKDSLIASAYLVKEIKQKYNGNGPWDEGAIREVAKRYFSGNNGICAYPGGSYCDDLWKSYSTCVAGSGGSPTNPGPAGISVTCPISQNNTDFRVTCGTQADPIPGSCGHGGIGYPQPCDTKRGYACVNGDYTIQLKKALDVTLKAGGPSTVNKPVYLPYINGNQSINWTVKQAPQQLGGGFGWKVLYEGDYNGKKITIDMTHINSNIKTTNLKSGDQVATVYNVDGNEKDPSGHLHTAVAIDGVWVEPRKDLNMCTIVSP